jgi:hypothetical protein
MRKRLDPELIERLAPELERLSLDSFSSGFLMNFFSTLMGRLPLYFVHSKKWVVRASFIIACVAGTSSSDMIKEITPQT